MTTTVISLRGLLVLTKWNNLQCSRQTEVLSRGPCCSNHPEASASDQPPFPAFHLLINLPLLQHPQCKLYLGGERHLVEMSAVHKLSRDVSEPGCPPATPINIDLIKPQQFSADMFFLWTSPSPSCRADMACWTCWVLFKHRIQLCCCDRIVPTFQVVIGDIKFLSWWR